MKSVAVYRTTLCTIICFLLPINVAPAVESSTSSRVVVVALDGSGTYSEIQRAIDESKPGDTILIKAGNYREDVVVHSKNRLRLVGESRDSVIIQGLKRVGAFRIGKWPYGADDIEIRDLTVSENGGLAVGIFNGSRIVLSNLRIHGMLYVQQATDVKIERSQLGDSEDDRRVFLPMPRAELVENEIRNNDYGVSIAGKSDVRVEANFFEKNLYEAVRVEAGAKATIVGNTIVKGSGTIKVDDKAQAQLSNNKIYSHEPGVPSIPPK